MGSVSAAPGEAQVFYLFLGCILNDGSRGIKKASQVSILNANYIAKKLSPHFKILYTGKMEM